MVAYRAKPGKEVELHALAREHTPFLRELGLATDRPHILATAADGTVVEVFKWVEGGMDKAHHRPAVGELWQRYAEVCDFVPLNSLEESAQMFANFTPEPMDRTR